MLGPLLFEWPFLKVHQLLCNVELQKNVSVFVCVEVQHVGDSVAGCQIQIQVNSWLTVI